jgi:hypothetical protein
VQSAGKLHVTVRENTSKLLMDSMNQQSAKRKKKTRIFGTLALYALLEELLTRLGRR